MAKNYNMDKIIPAMPMDISDLFAENKSNKEVDIEEKIVEGNKNRVVYIKVDRILPYANHHFSKGDEWESFVESIRIHGIMEPVILRKHPVQEGFYETIAGHNRTQGAKEAELTEVPAIIIEVNDIDASVLVGVTNKQRNPSDIEWGWAYRETYELIKRSAGRPAENGSHDDHNFDNENNCAQNEHNLGNAEIDNCAHGEHNLKGVKTIEILAEKYGESRASIQRKMRLTYLIEPLAELFTKKKLTQAVAVELSYLDEMEQERVNTIIFTEKVKVTPQMATQLKEASKALKTDEHEESLSLDAVHQIMVADTGKEKGVKVKPVKYSVPDVYFPAGLNKKAKESYVIKALQYIQENGIQLESE